MESEVHLGNPVMSQLHREAAGLPVTWQIGTAENDGFTIDRHEHGWSIRANNPRSALWALHHLRSNGRAGDYCPRFAIRGLNVCESLARHEPEQVDRLLDRMADWRMNRLIVHPQYGWREHAARIERGCAARGIEIVHYVYTTIAFTPHAGPELIAKDIHGRPQTPRVECYTRLCASEPAARTAFREGARRYFQEHVTDGQRLILQTADGLQCCACPGCRKRSAIAQWQPFLEIAVEEAMAARRNLKLEFIAYVYRFQVPPDMTVFQHIDSVMYDLHWRYRLAALDQSHPPTEAARLQASADPRAQQMPMNQYLLDRLRDWRQAFGRQVYVFENLMLQGMMSIPAPYTPALHRDLELFEQDGIDGIVYEAYEPGIQSFQRQLTCLSRRLWNDPPDPALEAGLDWMPEPAALAHYPLALEFPFELEFAAAGPGGRDPELLDYLELLKRCMDQRTWPSHRALVQYLLKHPRRFDVYYIAFAMAKRVLAQCPIQPEGELARQFLASNKLWDFMAAHADRPREAVREALHQLHSAT